MYEVHLPQSFVHRAKRVLRHRPDLRDRFEELVVKLSQDPFQPKLRLHPLSGALPNLHAVRLTSDVRVVLTLVIEERSITWIDIGGHDQVYR